MSERDVRLPGGRTLHVYEGGDPDGPAVLVHHGTPSSGLLHEPHARDAEARGLRLLGYDRPGYGGSGPQPGRTVGDAAADAAALLDALGVERFATWGLSGGGPHALACAALLPGRCVAAAALAAVAPYEAEGLDWMGGMGEANVVEFDAALAGPAALEPLLAREAAEMFAGGPGQLRRALLTVLSPPDREATTAELGDFLYATMERGAGAGIEGWRDDDLAFCRPWGFDVASISVPVLLLQGVEDLMVPPGHGRWLAARIPGVAAEISGTDGHLTLLDRVPEVHAWLHERLAAAEPVRR